MEPTDAAIPRQLRLDLKRCSASVTLMVDGGVRRVLVRACDLHRGYLNLRCRGGQRVSLELTPTARDGLLGALQQVGPARHEGVLARLIGPGGLRWLAATMRRSPLSSAPRGTSLPQGGRP